MLPPAALMDFGLQLPTIGPLAPGADLVSLTRRAEEIGLTTVWAADRLLNATAIRAESLVGVSRPRRTDPDAWYLDAMTVLAIVGGATTRIALGTRVLLPALRHPIVVAKEVAAMATMLGADRIVLGVGAGWMHEEFEAIGKEPSDRFALLEESVALVRAAWRGVSAFDGTHYTHVESGFQPVPTRSIPIIVGGTSPGAFRRAARIGDGWISRGMTPGEGLRAEAQSLLNGLRRACDEVGRDAEELCVIGGLPADASVKDVEVLADLGVDHCVLSLVDEADRSLERVEPLLDAVS